MFGYLLILTLYFWKKDKFLLEKCLNNSTWILGLIYGKMRSSNLFIKCIQYIKNTFVEVSIFGLKEHQLIPLNPYNWTNGIYEKYYVKVSYEKNNPDSFWERFLKKISRIFFINQWNIGILNFPIQE